LQGFAVRCGALVGQFQKLEKGHPARVAFCYSVSMARGSMSPFEVVNKAHKLNGYGEGADDGEEESHFIASQINP
jgi:hypothetical protein